MHSKASHSHMLPQIIHVSPQDPKSQPEWMKKRCDRGLVHVFFFFSHLQIFRSFHFQGYFLHCGLVRFLFLAKILSLSTATDELRIKCSHKTKAQKSNKMAQHRNTNTHTHVQTHMAVSRSRVANDVFTLVWGDCYFCAEPDNSIIHCGCWCTHFTSIERRGRQCLAHGVCSMCACQQYVCICMRVCCAREKTRQQQMNYWHARPYSGKGKEEEKEKELS